MYIGLDALGPKMYLGLPALKYCVVPLTILEIYCTKAKFSHIKAGINCKEGLHGKKDKCP